MKKYLSILVVVLTTLSAGKSKEEVELVAQTGHPSTLKLCLFSPGGDFFLTTDYQGLVVKLWSTKTGLLLRDFHVDGDQGAYSNVTDASFSQDGQLILIASYYSAYLFDTRSGKRLHKFQLNDMLDHKLILEGKKPNLGLLLCFTGVAFADDGKSFFTIVNPDPTSTKSYQIAQIEISSGSILRRIPVEEPDGRNLMRKKGGLLAVPSKVGLIIIDLASGHRKLIGNAGSLIAIDSQSTKFAILSKDFQTINIYDSNGVETNSAETPSIPNQPQKYFVGLRYDRGLLYLMTMQNVLRLDTDGWHTILNVSGQGSINFSNRGEMLATGDSGVLILSQANQVRQIENARPKGPIELIAMDSASNEIAYAQGIYQNVIHSVGLASFGHKRYDLPNPVTCLASGDDHIQLFGSPLIGKINSSALTFQLGDFRGGPLCRAVSKGKEFVYMAFPNQFAHDINHKTYLKIDRHSGHILEEIPVPLEVSALALSPNEEYLAIGFNPSAVGIVHLASGKMKIVETNDFSKPNRPVMSIAWSPKGDHFVTGHSENKIRVWALDLKLQKEVSAHTFYPMNLAFMSDGSKFVSSSLDGTMILWSADATIVRKIAAHTDGIDTLTIHPKRPWIITGGRDGLVKFWDMLGNPIATYHPVSDGFGIMALPNGTYAGQKASKAIAFRKGMRAYGFEQFDLRYNRPDIVLESLNPEGERSTETNEKIARFKQYWEYRVRQNDFTTDQILRANEIHAPEVFDVSVNGVKTQGNDFSGESAERTVKLSFKIKDEDASALNVVGYKIFVNGVPVHGQNIKRVEPQKVLTVMEEKIVLSAVADKGGQPGDNKIEISGFASDGVESYRESVYVRYTGATAKPKRKLYIVSLGINEYAKDSGFDSLTYAEKDSDEIVQLFSRLGDQYETPVVLQYKGKNVDRAAIRKIGDELKKTNVDDTVIFFVSGHGVRGETDVKMAEKLSREFGLSYTMGDPGKSPDKNNIYYYMTSAASAKTPWEKGIPLDGIRAALDKIPARQKLLLVDTCQSGEDPSLLGYTVSKKREKEMEDLLARSADEATRKGLKVVRRGSANKKGMLTTMAMAHDMKEMSEMFPELRRGTGTIEISAATGVQSALEDGKWENGAFTYAIKEFMGKEKSVSAKSLRGYVLDRVVTLTGGAQTPMVSRDIAGRDWEL